MILRSGGWPLRRRAVRVCFMLWDWDMDGRNGFRRNEAGLMLITREIDYALRILRRLQGGELVATPEICRTENLPLHFVYRILKKLHKAGIVDISRGKDGGARLDCDLSDITMYGLVDALGDHKYVSACTKPGYECEYRIKHHGRCGVHGNLASMQRELDDLFKARSILQMVSE
jgi:Rrf2 family protein